MAAALWRMGPGVLVCVLEIWLIFFFFFFVFVFLLGLIKGMMLMLKPAAPLRSRVQCVLCGAGFSIVKSVTIGEGD